MVFGVSGALEEDAMDIKLTGVPLAVPSKFLKGSPALTHERQIMSPLMTLLTSAASQVD